MAIHIRNLPSLDGTVTTGLIAARHLILLRELFLAGRWTQSAISNGATWDANIVLNLSDGAVNAAAPGRVTSATGGFTGKEGFALTLLGGVSDDDQNRGVYRISQVISDNEVEVFTAPPAGWVTDTGMTVRVFNWGLASPVSGANYVVMDPPVGNNQAYIGKPATNYYFDFIAYPRGAYPANPTASVQHQHGSGARRARWNAYFDGASALIYWYDDVSGWWCIGFGELDDADAADLYPGFLCGGVTTDCFNITNGDMSVLYMLYDEGGGSIGQVDARVASACRGSLTGGSRQNVKSLCRAVKGKAQIVKPWIYVRGVFGGYFRGRHPFARYTNSYWEDMRPMTPTGTWRHITESGVFPMNGPNDPRPIASAL